MSFARDGLAWECFGGCHGVTNLTKTQLQGIYGDCSITDWSQVGGTAGPIVVYGVNPGAGVKSNWNKYLGLSSTGDTFRTADAAHVIHQNENQEIFANGDEANAIFYFAISNWNTVIAPNPDGSALGSLEGVTPSEAHIADGTYALGFNEGFVYCAASTGTAPCPKKASKQTVNYVGETKGWVCKASVTGDHRGAHSTDPLTGDNYRLEIEHTLSNFGLVPIAYGPTGGSATGREYCGHVINLDQVPDQELIAMPAITVDDTLVLPRILRPDPSTSRARPIAKVITADRQLEGAGFSIRRPFPGGLSMAEADPFLLLDHLGPQVNGPGEAKGAPWHPHRGFETVSYILDGEIAHHDTNGGGGVIGEGDTQWMTAGGGILHDELPTERMYRGGGPAHAVQLWVNLPPALKMTAPRYQSITRDALRLLTSDDGGALIRLIAGDIAGFSGPGVTHTPIAHAHATLAPGAQLSVPWNPAFSALAYVLTGRGTAGPDGRPVEGGQLVVFGPGDHLVVAAAERQSEPLDALLLGGLPIRAPIAHYGPFVMNTREEIIQAIEDYEAGRLGIVPADQLAPRNFA